MLPIDQHLEALDKAVTKFAETKRMEPVAAVLLGITQDYPVLTKDADKFHKQIQNAHAEYNTGYTDKIDVTDLVTAFRAAIKARLLKSLPGEIRQVDVGVHDADAKKIRNSIIQSGLFIGRAPIIVQSTPAINREKLAAMGFPVSNIEGYTILKDQFVVGVHENWIRDRTTTVRNKKTDPYKEFLETLEIKYPQHINAGSGLGYFESRWIWFPQESELAAIQRASGRLKVNSWGFAFDGAAKR